MPRLTVQRHWDDPGGNNRAPVARLLGPTTVAPYQPIRVDPTTSADPDGIIKKWQIAWGDGVVSQYPKPLRSVEYAYNASGTYDITLTVWDNRKAVGSTVLTVTVSSPAPDPGNPAPVDCVLSDWVKSPEADQPEWGACSEAGEQVRLELYTRTVVTEPAYGGAVCGPLSKTELATQACDPPDDPLPVDCVLSNWVKTSEGAFSACQPDSTRTRTDTYVRTVVTPASNGGAPCGPLSKTEPFSEACVYVPPVPPPSGTGNAYFANLIARPEHHKSYSFRTQAQLTQYRASAGWPTQVTYGNDADPRAQDAAKVVMPLYHPYPASTLTASMTAAQTTIPANVDSILNRSYKIDSEILIHNGSLWLRGQAGTTATTHTAGTPVYSGTNSLLNYLTVPIGTQDGHTYLFTWDVWYGLEFRQAQTGGYKAFQLYSSGVWHEPQIRDAVGMPSTSVGQYTARSYGSDGPNISTSDPLAPMLAVFYVAAETWTRTWVLVDQRANDFDLVSTWIADPSRGPVQIHHQLQQSVRASNISDFWIEYNSSQDRVNQARPPMVSYVRNLVVLKDVADVPALLVRP